MRTPQEIAAAARRELDLSSKAFMPPALKAALQLSVEFMESVAAAMTPADAPVPSPAPTVRAA